MTRPSRRIVAAGNEARGLIAFGNTATGFIAIGNVVTGVIAFGNVARGFIAVGNVAIGIIAIGNVGFGVIFGLGATVGIGLASVAGAIALGVGYGAGAGIGTNDVLPLSLAPLVIWAVAAAVGKGTKRPKPPRPELTTVAALRDQVPIQGWVEGRLRDLGHEGMLQLESFKRSKRVSSISVARPSDFDPKWLDQPVYAHIESREEVNTEHQRGYREAPIRDVTFALLDIQERPRPEPIWSKSSYIQYYLATAWRAGAAVGILVALARLALFIKFANIGFAIPHVD